MPNEHCQRIDELIGYSKELSEKLQLANAEIGKLQLKIDHFEKRQLSLTENFLDANNEVERLSSLLKNQVMHC
jgi:hypothetical protein